MKNLKFVETLEATAPTSSQFLRAFYLKFANLAEPIPPSLASALFRLLTEDATEEGWMSKSRLEERLGPYASKLIESLLDETAHGVTPGVAPYEWFLEGTPLHVRKAVLSRERVRVTDRMPAVAAMIRRYGPTSRHQKLKVFGRTHLVGNTLALLDMLEPGHYWGKLDSVDPRVAELLRLKGSQVEPELTVGETERLEQQVTEELTKIPDPERYTEPLFLLLDDGGILIEAIAALVREKFPSHAHLFAAVEQTQSGINRLKRRPPPFAVIDVPDSRVKARYGSPMFGYAVFRSTMDVLERLAKVGIARPRRVGVIGGGHVGSHILKWLEGAHFDEVMVHDIDPKVQDGVRAPVRAVSRRELIERCDLVITAMGTNDAPLGSQDLAYAAPGAIWANGGSPGQIQVSQDDNVKRDQTFGFGTGEFFAQFQGKYPSIGTRDSATNDQVWTTTAGNQVFVVGGGKVVNWLNQFGNPKSGNVIPAEYIQLEVGALALAVFQAAEGGKPGLHPIYPWRQRHLLREASNHLKALGRLPFLYAHW